MSGKTENIQKNAKLEDSNFLEAALQNTVF